MKDLTFNTIGRWHLIIYFRRSKTGVLNSA